MPGFSTRAIKAAGHVADVAQTPVTVPIYQTSTFEVGSAAELEELLEFRRPGHSYTRYSNPTHAALEGALAELEGGEAALATASGMAAIHGAILSLVRTGDEVLIPAAVYGGTVGLFHGVMPRLGITHRQVRSGDTAAVIDAIGPRTRLVWLETIANPTTEMADIAAIAEAAHERGVPVVVDNTFASPYLCNPLALGADLVVHSVTKYIGGHSDLIGGAVIGSADRVAGGARGGGQHRRQRQPVRGVPGAARPANAGGADGPPLRQRPGRGPRARGPPRHRAGPVPGARVASAARAGRPRAARRPSRRDDGHRAVRWPPGRRAIPRPDPGRASTPPAWRASSPWSATPRRRRIASTTTPSWRRPGCRPGCCASRSASRTPMTWLRTWPPRRPARSCDRASPDRPGARSTPRRAWSPATRRHRRPAPRRVADPRRAAAPPAGVRWASAHRGGRPAHPPARRPPHRRGGRLGKRPGRAAHRRRAPADAGAWPDAAPPTLVSQRSSAALAAAASAYLADEAGFLDRFATDLRLAAAEAALADPSPAAPAGMVADRLRRGVAVVADGELLALHPRPAGRALAARFAAAFSRLFGTPSARAAASRRLRDGLWIHEQRIRPGAAVWLFDDLPMARIDEAAAEALAITLRALLRRPPARLPRSSRARRARADRARRPVKGASEPLDATLLAVARANGRVAPAARSLGVHRNTVLYRLRMARDRRGIDPRRPEDALRLLREAERDPGRSARPARERAFVHTAQKIELRNGLTQVLPPDR